MNTKNTTSLRWICAVILSLALLPILVAWRTSWRVEAHRQIEPTDAGIYEADTEIVVQFRPGTTENDLTDLTAKTLGTISWNSSISQAKTGIATIVFSSDDNDDNAKQLAVKAIELLRRDPRVEAVDKVRFYRLPDNTKEEIASAEADTIPGDPLPDTAKWRPNDPRYNEQWNFQMVKAEEAWEVSKGKDIIVAVIDTGVAYKDISGNKRARDFGDTKFVPGYDFVNKTDQPYDDQGHGTHVAGTIAESTNNREGVAGLAFEAKIMPLKVLSSSGIGRSSDIAEAIRWAADHGANVINMSLGSPFPDSLIAAACEYAHKKGVVIVCAAGNSGREGVGYPAAYKECIAVSAVGPKGDLSFYSSWGRQIAIAAPGGDKEVGGEEGGILQNTVLYDENNVAKDDYYAFQGTSMASPHVAAIAAMVMAKGVRKPDDVRNVLQRTAQKKSSPAKYGAGIVDASSAVRLAATTHGDSMVRLSFVLLLYVACFGIGYLRKQSSSKLGAPFWGTTALAFGLIFPDWLTSLVGHGSLWNLIGHSVLIPGALLILGATNRKERRLLALMSLGLTLHLGWEFLRSTMPFGPEMSLWHLLPWVSVNLIIGFGILVTGLFRKRD